MFLQHPSFSLPGEPSTPIPMQAMSKCLPLAHLQMVSATQTLCQFTLAKDVFPAWQGCICPWERLCVTPLEQTKPWGYTTQGRTSFGPTSSQRQKIKHLMLDRATPVGFIVFLTELCWFLGGLLSLQAVFSWLQTFTKVSIREKYLTGLLTKCLSFAALLRVYQVVLEPFELSQPQPPALIPKMKNSANTWVHITDKFCKPRISDFFKALKL